MNKCACKGAFLDKLIQPTILALVGQTPMHGFSLLKEMQTMRICGCGEIDPTGLYRTLKKMELAGLLTSHWDTSNTSMPPRRIYSITLDGLECLSHWKATLTDYRRSIDELVDRIAGTLEQRP